MRPRLPSPELDAVLRRNSVRGFTAVEVLISMTIMAVGAAAVMSMQKASVQGNLDARKTDLANSIARMWVERLRRDSMQWTPVPANAATASNPNPSNLTATKLLSNPSSTWFLPSIGNDPLTMSYAFDILGRDLLTSDIKNVANVAFCVNLRLKWLVNNDLIRADVRVFWPQGISTVPAAFCQSALGDQPEVVPEKPAYHAIYVTTALAMNPAQQ